MAGDPALIILALRTDKPQAELYLYDDSKKLSQTKWQAHMKLAETLNSRIEKILNKSSISYEDLGGIAIFKGPGSFTGLRIGIAVANALAYGLSVPIVGNTGEDWLEKSIQALKDSQNNKIAIPEYGAPVHTTKPRK
ncbi:MAG TPA: tRNA (adenosine(37)-N6)-threonylcarbamoyltransferase complex dimerization subunit type 1 TsaB [Candidatus Saccharimonadales bacterium]|nr:tRNA (adenosine(37)-N6)-threonylcarbamoyltransferase complex dimerization subunit type 1 TsaB [Candidatus Saccharimonadales bacterium]